jgi:hypothetical protein
MIFILVLGVSRLLNARLDIVISTVAARQAAIFAWHPTRLSDFQPSGASTPIITVAESQEYFTTAGVDK